MGFHDGGPVETGGENPQELQRRTVLRVKHLEHHRASRAQRTKAGQCLRGQESLDRVFLTIVVIAEVEPAISSVQVRRVPQMRPCGGSKGGLICQTVEIPGVISAVGYLNRRMSP